MIEQLCVCTKDHKTSSLRSGNHSELNFIKGEQYNVDVYDLWCCVHIGKSKDDYEFLNKDEFLEDFELI